MKGFAAVFGREIQDRRLLLVAGALAGLVPFATPLLTAHGGQTASTTRLQVALAISLVAGAVLALLLGATVVAGDLAERRLGFYFSRPLPAWAIWAGKMGAAVALTLLTSCLVLLPTLLFGGSPRSGLADLNGGTLAAALAGLGGAIALVSCSHAVSVILRQRSAWVVLDLAASGLVAGALWAICSGFLAWGAVDTSQRVLLGFAAFAAAVAAVAGAVQVIAGRVDGRRAHRCLSLSLWSGLLAGVLLLSGYAWWFLHPAPEDLGDFAPPVSDPTGRWLALAGNPRGRAADYWLTFVLDGRTGRLFREPNTLGAFSPRLSPAVAFSADGGTAVWGEAQPRAAAGSRDSYTLVRLDLAHPMASPVETQVAVAHPDVIALSPHGDRVATREGDRLLVHDLATGRLLASSALPPLRDPAVRMPDDRRVLLLNLAQGWTSPPLHFPLPPQAPDPGPE